MIHIPIFITGNITIVLRIRKSVVTLIIVKYVHYIIQRIYTSQSYTSTCLVTESNCVLMVLYNDFTAQRPQKINKKVIVGNHKRRLAKYMKMKYIYMKC